jgi:hypothetical protein
LTAGLKARLYEAPVEAGLQTRLRADYFVPAAAVTSAFVSGLSGFGGCAWIHEL